MISGEMVREPIFRNTRKKYLLFVRHYNGYGEINLSSETGQEEYQKLLREKRLDNAQTTTREGS